LLPVNTEISIYKFFTLLQFVYTAFMCSLHVFNVKMTHVDQNMLL